MEQDFEKRLQGTGVTRGAYAVLSAVHHDQKATPAELASFLGIDGAAVTRHLDRVEDMGLIRRKQSATDRRSIDLGLTPKGIRTVEKSRACSEATNKKFTACLTAAQADDLRSAIRTMLASADQSIPDI